MYIVLCVVGMKFPVDLLAGVSQSEVERSAHAYMNSLLYSNPDCPDQLRLSDSTQVNTASWLDQKAVSQTHVPSVRDGFLMDRDKVHLVVLKY